jgi:ATP synthase protein I
LAGSFAGMSQALYATALLRGAGAHGSDDGMAENGPQEDPELPRDARLDSLDERLRQARQAEAKRAGQVERKPQTGQAQGMRILSVLVSYPLGSALIGYVVDRLAGTHGIWVAMLFVGFGVAMWEVWKISNQKPQ